MMVLIPILNGMMVMMTAMQLWDYRPNNGDYHPNNGDIDILDNDGVTKIILT